MNHVKKGREKYGNSQKACEDQRLFGERNDGIERLSELPSRCVGGRPLVRLDDRNSLLPKSGAPEPGAFYVMDRAYVDFERLFAFTLCSSFFVVRTKKNILLQRRYSHRVDKSTGVRSDQTVILTASASAKAYPDALRRVSYVDAETNKRLKFLTNNFALPAVTIAQIYKSRWHS